MACSVESFKFEFQQGWDEGPRQGGASVDFSLSSWKLGVDQNEEASPMGGMVRQSSALSIDSDTTDTSSSDGSPRDRTPRPVQHKAVVGLLRRTTSAKRKRGELLAAARPAKSPRAVAGVRFSTESRVRRCDTVNAAPSGACPYTDSRATVKTVDGPNDDSVLLDSLVVNYFENGQLETGADVVELLGVHNVRVHGAALRGRLEEVCAQLDGVGKNVGLLPSNVRLGATHVPHLRALLGLVVTACECTRE